MNATETHIIRPSMAEWQTREATRLETGHYKPLPFGAKIIVPSSDPRYEHFPHISRDTPELMAYTQSPDKGTRDIKTKIKPGAYLKRFFADKFSPPEIAALANEYRAIAVPDDTQLIFAESPLECVAAYQANTASCMSFPTNAFAGPVHPASVYGSPDLAYATVAYLKRGDRITAKALVNRAALKYQSCHGDDTNIKTRLNALGYSSAYSCLYGLRLHAIPHDRLPDGRLRFVAPCIDGHSFARHDAADGTLVLLNAAEYDKTPKDQRVQLGYNAGLTG